MKKVETLKKMLKDNISVGHDSIIDRILKTFIPIVSDTICILFNQCNCKTYSRNS